MKINYCPLKYNRQVDDSGAVLPYRRVDGLQLLDREKEHGKIVKLKGFPKDHMVKLFRVVLSTQHTDYFVTNDFTQDNMQVLQGACSLRWIIERFHRQTKQLTGLEDGQCRQARIMRNHIGFAILMWIKLNQVAQDTQRTIYQVKHGLLSDYLRQQLKTPAILMTFA